MKKIFLPLIGLIVFLSCSFMTACKQEPAGPSIPSDREIEVREIEITGAKDISVGDTLQLSVTVSPSTATNKEVSWSVSPESCATISAKGLLSANAAGTVTVTATAKDGSDVEKSVSIKISAAASSTVAVTGISLNKTSVTLNAGDSETLTATVSPSNATDKTVTWTSSDTSVATVSNGVVIAKAAGTSIITAAAGGKSATCNVTVSEASSTPVDNNLITTVSKTTTFYATGDLWSSQTTATASGSLSAGFTYTYPLSSSAQWQKQLKLFTDADISEGEKWSFSITLKSTSAVTAGTVKLCDSVTENGDTVLGIEDGTVSLVANTAKTITLSGTSTVSITDILIALDFGPCDATSVTVTDISFTKESSSSGSDPDPEEGSSVPAALASVTIPSDAIVIFDSGKGIDKINNAATWGNAVLSNVTVAGKTVKKYELTSTADKAIVCNLKETVSFLNKSTIYLSVYADNNFAFAYTPGEGGDKSQTHSNPGTWKWMTVSELMTGKTYMDSIAFSSSDTQTYYIDHIYIVSAGDEPVAWSDETASAGAEAKKAIGTSLNISGLSDYKLVWADDFTDDERDSDGTPLSSNWGYDVGRGNSTNTDGTNPGNWAWGNNEDQWYSNNDKDNTWVSNGTLKIRAIKEDNNGTTYSSGRIVTRNISGAQFKYGYVEMRAKIPVERGVWPAFWMLDNDIYNGQGWPLSGEIDIMESSTSVWGKDKVYGTLHCQSGSGGSPIYTAGTTLDDIEGEWHTYAVLWTENSITWYYDGQPANWTMGNQASDSNATYEPNDVTSKSDWPYNEPFYIIINLAVGGNLGGSIDSSWTNSTMTIDYVRVYQK